MIRLLYLLPLLALPWVWPWVRDGTWVDRPAWGETVIDKGDE